MKNIIPLLLCLIFILSSCVERIIEPEDLSRKNNELSESIFTAKADIYPHFIESHEAEPEKLLKRGEKVHLIIEISNEWVKVKAYDEKTKRQQAVGKTVIYLFKKDLSENSSVEQILDDHINRMFIKAPIKK